MSEQNEIILFDGVCNFCQGSVKFIIKYDKTKKLKFASLQSEIGQELRATYQIPEATDSIVFIKNYKAYLKSSAALRIATYLSFPLNWLYIFIIIPPFIRNFLYDIIAKNRYKWFGKQDACMLPTPEIRSRFLD
ncbi:MAG: DCC1-like thiol-disulfide oxidoreductase family protein [Chitinophagales bacterium]|jgi:predicted DCC family thiol-disulfide oxidoreductase YuxK